MAKIEIYTSANCFYCVQAKKLLESKGASYHEIRVDLDAEELAEMLERAQGRRTVPQIFINGQGIGGFDELSMLSHSGELDELLKQEN